MNIVNNKNIEQGIVDHLNAAYRPQAIILTGSRAGNEAQPLSDWDVVLYVDQEQKGILEEFKGEMLDITFVVLPIPTDAVLQVSFAPDPRMKILKDTHDGLAAGIVERTLERYQRGPEPLTNEGYLQRKNKLSRLLSKALSRPDDEGHVFNYVGAVYEFAIRYWFEVRGEWPMPLYKALPYIQNNDPEFYNLLQIIYGRTGSEEKLNAARQIFQALFL